MLADSCWVMTKRPERRCAVLGDMEGANLIRPFCREQEQFLSAQRELLRL